MLSDHYFGDVEAIDEGRNHTAYFQSTFMVPSSFSVTSLNNKRKFLIIGRKGAGKTAVQFHLAKQLESKGYLTHFFSFNNDMKAKDFTDATKTQKIDYVGIANQKNVFLGYDFREIWERTFLTKFAEQLEKSGYRSNFTKFALGERGKLATIFEGIQKSLSLKISGELVGFGAEVGIDFSQLSNGEIPLGKYVSALKLLLKRYHLDGRFYLFVDELVFSRLDATDDEFKVRAAMVRDIFRSARDLNNFFAQEGMDFNVICSLRPEIRDMINELDAEIGKVFDGKGVTLEWRVSDEDDSPLMQILKNKVIYSRQEQSPVDFDKFFSKTISFLNKKMTIGSFMATNSWGRPRDVVQLLNSIADRNPSAETIGESELKNSLIDYSRKSYVELLEEISVRHGPTISQTLRENIRKKEYPDYETFEQKVFGGAGSFDRSILSGDLFRFGVIGNIDKSRNPIRFHWAHRGDAHFDKKLGVQIHPGLWHFLQVQ